MMYLDMLLQLWYFILYPTLMSSFLKGCRKKDGKSHRNYLRAEGKKSCIKDFQLWFSDINLV